MLSRSVGIGRYERLQVKVGDIDEDAFVFRVEVGDITSLARSIERYGLLQPLILRQRSGTDGHIYELLAGHRRLAACKKLGMIEVSAQVVDVNEKDAFIMALTENVQSKSLNAIEEAMAFQSYIHRKGWGGASELARNIGKSPAYISQRLKLLQLPENIRAMVANNNLPPFTAAELNGLNSTQAETVLASMGGEGATLRRVRSLARQIRGEGAGDIATQPSELEKYSTVLKMFILYTRRALNEMDATIHKLGEGSPYYKRAVRHRYDLHRLLDSMINEHSMVKRQLLTNEL